MLHHTMLPRVLLSVPKLEIYRKNGNDSVIQMTLTTYLIPPTDRADTASNLYQFHAMGKDVGI